MISVPSPFQPYRVLTDEPTTLRCIISEQILMQPRLVVKILSRQPVAHHWPAPGASSCSRCRHTQTRADTVPDFTHCEFYSWVEGRSVRLSGQYADCRGLRIQRATQFFLFAGTQNKAVATH